jgi:hypothetical protein
MIFSKRSGPHKPGEGDTTVQTQYSSSQMSGEGLEREYEEVVRAQLARLGVPQDTVEVEVRPAGTMQDGRSVYLGMVRLVKWDARTSFRLLVALPLLEAKTRQSLDTSWLMDVSHFGGLWVHASSAVRTSDVLVDIRAAITRLELGARIDAGESKEAGWSASVQAVLDDPERFRSGGGD